MRHGHANLGPVTILLVVALTAIVAAATACGGGDEEETATEGVTPAASASPATGVEPKLGGTFRISLDRELLTLDPHISVSYDTLFATGAASNGVLQLDKDGEIVGDLAESWQYNTPTELVVKLHQGVKWQNVAPLNGRELVADDVVYSLTRMGTNDPRFTQRALMGNVDKIEAPDQYTVKVTLKEPDAYFLDTLANPWVLVVSKELVAQQSDGELKQTIVGTGPFILSDYNKAEGAKLKRNPDYFGKDAQGRQLPFLDGVSVLVISNTTAQKAAFKSGQLDITSVSAQELDELKRDVPNAVLTKFLYGGAAYTGMHYTRGPFSDVRVRQAVMYATDADEFIRTVVQGAGERLTGPVPKSFGKWALPDSFLWQYDPEKAKQLLAEAGYPDGFKTSTEACTVAQYDIQAQVMQSQLKKVGIDVSVKIVPFNEWASHAYKKQFDIYTCSDQAFPTVDAYIYRRFHTGGGSNTIDYSNAKVDELLDKQRVTVDEDERLQIVHDLQELIMADLPQVNIYQRYVYMLTQSYVRDYYPALLGRSSSNANLFQYVWLDK